MKHFLQACKDEATSLLVLLTMLVIIGAVGAFLYIWLGDYAMPVALVLCFVGLQLALIADRMKFLRQRDTLRNERRPR